MLFVGVFFVGFVFVFVVGRAPTRTHNDKIQVQVLLIEREREREQADQRGTSTTRVTLERPGRDGSNSVVVVDDANYYITHRPLAVVAFAVAFAVVAAAAAVIYRLARQEQVRRLS